MLNSTTPYWHDPMGPELINCGVPFGQFVARSFTALHFFAALYYMWQMSHPWGSCYYRYPRSPGSRHPGIMVGRARRASA